MVAQSASQQLLQCKNGNEMEIGGDFNLGQLESEGKVSERVIDVCFDAFNEICRIFEVKIVSIA